MSLSSRFAAIFSSGGLDACLDEAFKRAAVRGASEDSGDFDAQPIPGGPMSNEHELAEPLLSGEQLLHMLRAPIEWVLALAHRLAAGDAEDAAAVDRLRAAFYGRVAGRPIRLRMTDVLVAAGILVGALDLDVVIDAVSRTFGDGLVTMVAAQQATLVAQLAALAEVLPMTVHHAVAPRPSRQPTAQPNRSR